MQKENYLKYKVQMTLYLLFLWVICFDIAAFEYKIYDNPLEKERNSSLEKSFLNNQKGSDLVVISDEDQCLIRYEFLQPYGMGDPNETDEDGIGEEKGSIGNGFFILFIASIIYLLFLYNKKEKTS